MELLGDRVVRLSAFILQVDRDTYNVVGEIARGRATLSDYDLDNNSGFSDFEINVEFETPTVVELMSGRDYDFYIGYEATGWTAGDPSFYMNTQSTDRLVKLRVGDQTNSDSPNDWKIVSPIPSTTVLYALRIVRATAVDHENTYSKDGFTYASIELTQGPADLGQVEPPLESLNIIALVEGFCDYDTGNRILSADQAIAKLSYEWNGESWVDVNAVDTSTLYSSHYVPLLRSSGTYRARYLTGIIEGKSSYSNVIESIVRGSAAKIGILSSKKLFTYPWGVTVSPAFNIPQADIIPLSWEMRDISTVINRTSVIFNKIYALDNLRDSIDGYGYSIDFSNPAYLASRQITEESRTLYGIQNIVENRFSVFGYSDYYTNVGLPGYLTGEPSDSQPVEGNVVVFSVDFLAEYYMARFGLPAVYCSFVIPWHRYKNIKMFDIINFAHSEFPAFYGTDPSARPGVVISGSSTTTVPNATYGQELTRAQTYRGLVEGISYVMAMEHAPSIRLTVLVLLNREFDPT